MLIVSRLLTHISTKYGSVFISFGNIFLAYRSGVDLFLKIFIIGSCTRGMGIVQRRLGLDRLSKELVLRSLSKELVLVP